MKTTEIKTIRLEAEEGKVLTDGKVYGTVIFLAVDRSPDEFYEISPEEYGRILAEESEELTP